eukprot:NODE_4932_length_1830_cov_3.800352.p1 GENE.NODE_4932_length_1830_cov_3.800352~~NODE_4932_length_1830_cov_3.800352.p1  ORF type:complete len:513 (+),score=140.18 NODE_4932_length_1830_cov_3.800352:71-1609(+)
MVLESEYEVLCRLGEGTFGTVYKAQHRKSGDHVAVKEIKLGSRSWEDACRSFELQALRALRHPFIVRLRELIRSQNDGSLYYVFEFLDTDLRNLVTSCPSGVEESRAAELTRQLLAGLAHMHQHNFFHRDVKPENVLLESVKDTIRIADLGQARSLRARPPFTDYVGTRWYRAPECLLRDRTYSSPVDVWAAGLIFAELLRGSPLFCGTSTVDQLYKIFAVLGQPLHDWPDFARLAQAIRFRLPEQNGWGLACMLPQQTSAVVQALIAEVLTLNPRRRPLARKCADHALFASAQADERAEPSQPELPPDVQPGAGKAASDVDFDAELDKILGSSSFAARPATTHLGSGASRPSEAANLEMADRPASVDAILASLCADLGVDDEDEDAGGAFERGPVVGWLPSTCEGADAGVNGPTEASRQPTIPRALGSYGANDADVELIDASVENPVVGPTSAVTSPTSAAAAAAAQGPANQPRSGAAAVAMPQRHPSAAVGAGPACGGDAITPETVETST